MRRFAHSIIAALCLASSASAQSLPFDYSAEPQLWFRADRGVSRGFSGLVSVWDGQAGNAITQPDGARMPKWRAHDINRRPALHFDGNDSLTRSDGMPTGDYTKVAVVTIDDYQAANNVLSGASEHAMFFGSSDRAKLFHSGTFVTSGVPTPLGEPTLLIGTYDASTGEGRLYQNGQWVAVGYAAPHGDPTIQIGSFASGNNFRGSIAEVMVYDRVLSDADRQLLERVLLAKYRAGQATQLALSQWPADGAVIARDQSDTADIEVSGTVEAMGMPTIELRLRRDGVLVDTYRHKLADPWGQSPFEFTATIDAGLHEFEFDLSLRDGPKRLPLRAARSVVCGDLYLVNGQSNAVALDYHSEGLANHSQSQWIRSFGTSLNSAGVAFDHHWDLADGQSGYAHSSVGAWALRAAELLVAEHGIPIGLVNGAVGGTRVAQHQRNDANPEDLSTIYGRLLHRSRAAGIAEQYRAVLWHQGESDGENVAGWVAGFAAMRQDWAEDYPNVERIFLFQIRKGCGVTFAGVREAQRQLADDPQVSVMSTTAVPDHDGCHYRYIGYRTMGDRLSRLIDRDLYQTTKLPDIGPPNLDWAEWTDPSQTAIRLTFRDKGDTLIWQPGTEAYFQLADGRAVLSGTVSGNTITLQLAGASSAATVSYVGHPGNGPWVFNGSGVGALTFFDVPIE